jgi:hypothetical protein
VADGAYANLLQDVMVKIWKVLQSNRALLERLGVLPETELL